jgi:transcriptional regulator with XRE-family HTH domain
LVYFTVMDELRKMGARIKSLRKEKGYSNSDQFAYEKNIARAQYQRYESGSDLRFTTIVKLVKAFDMNLNEFFSEGFEE